MIKAQDVLVLLKFVCHGHMEHRELAEQLFMSTSTSFKSIQTLKEANLIYQRLIKGHDVKGARKKFVTSVVSHNAKEFIFYALKYLFPPEVGTFLPGIPTSYASDVFKGRISIGNDPIPVWAYYSADTTINDKLVKGIALKPIYYTVQRTYIEKYDKPFHDLLHLIDALRSGRARERNTARELIEQYFEKGDEPSPAIMEMAKRELEELEAKSDEAFLIRAEMDRKLVSL